VLIITTFNDDKREKRRLKSEIVIRLTLCALFLQIQKYYTSLMFHGKSISTLAPPFYWLNNKEALLLGDLQWVQWVQWVHIDLFPFPTTLCLCFWEKRKHSSTRKFDFTQDSITGHHFNFFEDLKKYIKIEDDSGLFQTCRPTRTHRCYIGWQLGPKN
jgi:hypothetical protein